MESAAYRPERQTAFRPGADPLKVHHDSKLAMADAVRAETRLRDLLRRQALVFCPEARKAARDCLEALDRFDALGVLARELGVQP
jgi:hypothetical protein